MVKFVKIPTHKGKYTLRTLQTEFAWPIWFHAFSLSDTVIICVQITNKTGPLPIEIFFEDNLI